MKALRPALGLFFLSMLIYNNSMAQKASYTSPGGISIGFGVGYAYQKSDLANSKGYGFDFILGSQIYQKENAFLSVDWKFRFLAGQNKAYDHRINPDNTYSNIRYSFFSYDLELGLTLNRLRERTGIILTGFAGAGITHGRTFTDLYDAGNNLYDYGVIDPSQDSKSVYNDLVTLSDGDFETRLVNKAALLPTAGLYLGYQFSRSFAIGIEFKSNFYFPEKNSWAGIDLDNRVMHGSGIDRNNYVSLGFKWRIGGGSASRNRTNTYSSGTTNTYGNPTNTGTLVVAASLPQPSVNITDPPTESMHTESPLHTIRASISNVSGSDNISFSQNGFPNNSFTYNASTLTFIASVRLRDGENIFSIEARNQHSTAEDMAIITLGNPLETDNAAPSVEFTSPAGTQFTSPSDRIDVNAYVKNISSKKGIQLTLNGSATPFDYYPVSGLVKTSVYLLKGDNQMQIEGSNESGSAQDQLTVYYDTPENMVPPTVRFINPPAPLEVINNRFPLKAEVRNVSRRNDVRVSYNGASVSNFSFDDKGTVALSLILPEGVNTLEIYASNESGEASESTFITYHKPVYNQPVYYQPVNNPPVNNQPVYRPPVNNQPVYRPPVNNQPVNNPPVNHQPVSRPPVNNEPVIWSSPPVIQISNPRTSPLRTNEASEELRATVLNVSSKDNIKLNINGLDSRNFSYNYRTKEVIAQVGLREGENLLTISAQNETGSDAKNQVFLQETRPCQLPVIRLIDPVQGQSSTDQQIYALRAEVLNVSDHNQLRLSSNGKPVSFSFSNRILSTSVSLTEGTNTLSLSASNECGEDKVAASINYDPSVVIVPCNPPTVKFSLQEVKRNDASHELRGSVTGVENKADISITINGRASNGFQFAPTTGELSAAFKLAPGSHTLVVSVNNACGSDVKSESLTLEEEEEEACGIRINPGNSAWQFCLHTPSGTYTRDNLTNSNFSYSGPARSLYFMPIGGGGTATVNGKPYAIRSGQYYLFTGNINVSVSTSHPGSMGHWSVCITAGSAPSYGNGNKRPTSPCESQKKDEKPKAKDDPQPKPKAENKPKANEKVQPKADNNVKPRADNNVKPRVREDGNSNRNANGTSQRSGTRR